MNALHGRFSRWVTDGILTLYDALFQVTYTLAKAEDCVCRLQFAVASNGDCQVELIPLHSPLLGESLLVSFPPLSNMLKFGG